MLSFLAFSGHPFMLHGKISLDFMKTVLTKACQGFFFFYKVEEKNK